MRVMKVMERHNNILFTLSDQGGEVRAVQLVHRLANEQEKLYASTRIEVDDLVLVTDIPALLLGPNMPESEISESIGHIIIGLVPPSKALEIPNYADLVKGG